MPLDCSDLDTIYKYVHTQLVESGRIWHKFGEEPGLPTYDNVKSVIDSMIAMVRETSGSISVESGGILVKRTDDYIDVYVHAGGIK